MLFVSNFSSETPLKSEGRPDNWDLDWYVRKCIYLMYSITKLLCLLGVCWSTSLLVGVQKGAFGSGTVFLDETSESEPRLGLTEIRFLEKCKIFVS